jgi:hypothetical protein
VLPAATPLIAVAAVCAAVSAQPLDRLTGRVRTSDARPARDAEVRIEAIFGFAGGDYLGQRTFTARTDPKGAWAVLGVKAGIWVFDASLPGHVPDVVALPYNLVSPAGAGLAGVVPVWHPILKPTPLPPGDSGQILADAIAAARASRPERVAPLLARLSDTADAAVLDAAGRICLVMRDATVARPFFRRARDRDSMSFRAALGMGSTALMQRDVDAAARAFSEARALTKDKDEQSYLSAAILDLGKAHNVMRGTY